MIAVCLCGAPLAVHTAPVRINDGIEHGGCTWCGCDRYEEDVRSQNPPDEWMWLPERGYFR